MIYPIRRIVAGIATIVSEDPLLRPALDVAERTGATLHLVHAFELPDLTWDGSALSPGVAGRMLEEHTGAITARLEAQVRRVSTWTRVRCHAVAGPAPLVIQGIAQSEEADLILVGANRHWTVSRAILGTTAQRVLRGAGAPVLLLRGPLPDRLDRVLLTTDLSEFSAGIHEAALDVLETLSGGQVTGLKSLLVISYDTPLPPPLRQDTIHEVARGRLAEFLGTRRARGREIEGVVRFGEPVAEILAESEASGAAMVVVGTHARTTARRWIIGSVAEATVRGSQAAVLIIPARVEEQRILPAPVIRRRALTMLPHARGDREGGGTAPGVVGT